MELTSSYETAIPADVIARYEFAEIRNAGAIIRSTNSGAFEQVMDILREFELLDEDLTVPGGQESGLARRLNHSFRKRGWREGRVDTRIALVLRLMPFAEAGETQATVKESEVTNDGYKVDNIRDRIAMDLEC